MPNSISLLELNKLFYVVDGVLYNKITRSSRALKDLPAGCNDCDYGYIVLIINKKRYQAHRIIWQILNNAETIPNNTIIDHIDGNPTNNSISNLRMATRSQNQFNKKIQKNNDSGIKGVCVITIKGVKYYKCATSINYTNSEKCFPYTEAGLQLAQEWLVAKRAELHGDFARNS